MKYSHTYIKKMGKNLLKSKNPEEVAQAERIIEDWRGQHDIVLDEFENRLLPLLQEENIIIVDRGRRLKRLKAIVNKMDKHDVKNLSTMQDIGGMRIILPSIDVVNKIKYFLESKGVEDFEIINTDDYIDPPKPTGYRAIHIVFRYTPSDIKHECYGQKIELQLRTKYQHIWAMGVETAELITDTALKDGSGNKEWQDFFRSISACFYCADINQSLCPIDKKRDANELAKSVVINPKFIEELRSMMTMVEIDYDEKNSTDSSIAEGYYLMDINYKNRMSRILFFKKEEKEKAIALYNRQEKDNKGLPKDVVLVSVPRLKNLKDMYPSYYFDASDFIALAYKYANKDMAIN